MERLMKHFCPFQSKSQCGNWCEWLDEEKSKCAFLVLKEDTGKLLNILYDYISRDIQIKNAKDRVNE
jgi:hypothetical protein